MNLHSIGIDLGKTVFHFVGLNPAGEGVVRKKFSRTQLLRFTVNERVCFDEVSYVSDVNAQLSLAILEALDMNCIVELLSAIWIDGECLLASEIAARRKEVVSFARKRPLVKSDVFEDSFGELFGGEVVVSQQRVSLDPEIAHLT